MYVALDLERYTEPLEAEELSFLEKKEAKSRTQYYRVFQLLMFLSFIIPFAGAWYRAVDMVEDAFSPLKYFATCGTLLTLSSVSTYITYRANLRKLQLDLTDRTKTIEINHVMRKAYFPSSSTYYFYIDSKVKLSIEVSHADYIRLAEGDEVAIEYTTHSKEYLGYF